MTRPGVEVFSTASSPARGVPTDTSVAFVLSEAAMGPLDAPAVLRSLNDYAPSFGDRLPTSLGYDTVDTLFREGVTTIYYQRIDDGSEAATFAGDAIAAGTVIDAANPGTWGNGLKVQAVNTPGGGGTYMVTVSVGGTAVQTSQPISTDTDLAAFLASGSYATLDGASGGPLKVGTVTLADGTDGVVPAVAEDALDTGLAALSADYGPGQVLAPGRADEASHGAILEHCAGVSLSKVNRIALLDPAITDGVTELTSAATALRAMDEARYGSLWGPWAIIPGLAPGTTRVVPWTAIEAGILARNDQAGNPNLAGAGPNGVSNYAIGLVQTFSDDERETLLYAGVDTARSVYGTIEAYAFRTLVDPNGPNSAWRELNHARLNMAIVAQSEAIGEQFVFSQIDGRGHTIARFNGALAGMLKTFFDIDALFGDTPADAFEVNTGSAVNTTDTIADGVLKAVLSVRMSPHAELVQIYIVKYPITVALA
jgi:hypothetical protein